MRCIGQYSKYIVWLNKDIAYKLELGVTMNIQYAVQISKKETFERKNIFFAIFSYIRIMGGFDFLFRFDTFL